MWVPRDHTGTFCPTSVTTPICKIKIYLGRWFHNYTTSVTSAVLAVCNAAEGWAKRTLWKRAWPDIRVGAPWSIIKILHINVVIIIDGFSPPFCLPFSWPYPLFPPRARTPARRCKHVWFCTRLRSCLPAEATTVRLRRHRCLVWGWVGFEGLQVRHLYSRSNLELNRATLTERRRLLSP